MALGAGLVVLLQPEPVPAPLPIPVPVAEEATPAAPVPAPPAQAPIIARGDLSEAERSTVELFRQASPSVVFITKLAVRWDPLRRNAMALPEGTGSGFLWDSDGHIVTNYHVVAGADGARVTLGDQSVWPAQLVGAYPDKDIAVLRIQTTEERPLPPLPVGESGNLEVGQHVFAIGNPFGLDHTLSAGVISGLGREIMSVSQTPIQGVIQTDAAINPGNSGGPLLDSAGRLIGVNTAIYSPSGASAGVGFAVPVDTVRRIVPQLIRSGRVVRAGLGVQITDDRLNQQFDIRGALIVGVVPGSGAAEAGLRPTRQDPLTGRLVLGDIVVSVDGHDIENGLDLYRVLDGRDVGDVVRCVVLRGGRQRIELSVRLSAVQ